MKRVIVLCIAVLALAGCSAKVSTTATTTATTAAPPATTGAPNSTPATPPPTTKAPGQPTGADGSFKFTVTSQQCGLTMIGTDPFTVTAPAGTQWCIYGLNVANVKSSAKGFGSSNQNAVDSSNRQLDVDDSALARMPNGVAAAFTNVNPGVSIDVQIPFQISTGDSIKYLILHDSGLSGGVKVNVG